MTTFPNQLFERGRDILGRYGYRPRTALDDAEAWAALEGDFVCAVPAWDRLAPSHRRAAEEYLRLRRDADRRLDECEELHARLLVAGIGGELVERYAAARQDYEEVVEAFGEAREALERALRGG